MSVYSLLLQGDSAAFSSHQQPAANTYSAAFNSSLQHSKFTTAQHHESVSAYVFSVEDEEDTFSVRKQLLPIRFLIAVSYTFGLFYFLSYLKELPICSHLAYTYSHKYIQIRTLRI